MTAPTHTYMPLWEFSESMFGVSDLRWGKIFSFGPLSQLSQKSENYIAWWQLKDDGRHHFSQNSILILTRRFQGVYFLKTTMYSFQASQEFRKLPTQVTKKVKSNVCLSCLSVCPLWLVCALCPVCPVCPACPVCPDDHDDYNEHDYKDNHNHDNHDD